MDFESVVEQYGNSIVKYCYNLLWDHHEAYDAAQEVFLTAMMKQSILRDSASLTPWLYRIAYNICIDELRRRRRAKLFLSREIVRSEAETYVDNYDFGISSELLKALNTLSAKDRALVFNRVVDEMDFTQIEAIYGIKSSTLRKRYERARKKLGKELRKEAHYRE